MMRKRLLPWVLVGFLFASEISAALAEYPGPVERMAGSVEPQVRPGYQAVCLESWESEPFDGGPPQAQRTRWIIDTPGETGAFQIIVRYLEDTIITTKKGTPAEPLSHLVITVTNGTVTQSRAEAPILRSLTTATLRLLQIRGQIMGEMFRRHWTASQDSMFSGDSMERFEAQRQAASHGGTLDRWDYLGTVRGVISLDGRSTIVIDHKAQGTLTRPADRWQYNLAGYQLMDYESGFLMQDRRTITYRNGDQEHRDKLVLDCNLRALQGSGG